MSAPMIVFSDPYAGVGGGQLVMARLIIELQQSFPGQVALIMPADGRSELPLPDSIIKFDNRRQFLETRDSSEREILVVSNSNRGLPEDWLLLRKLRRQGVAALLLAIVHNYPRGQLQTALLRTIYSRADAVVGVEPGLRKVHPGIVAMPWLSTLSVPSGIGLPPSPPRQSVKAYARIDPVKGLHVLPAAFAELSKMGFECQVALGPSLKPARKYEQSLRKSLGPWLAVGRRSDSWVEPGDIVVIPSLAETTCLTAQEAVSRRAYVVASAVGVLPYLIYDDSSLVVVPPNDAVAIVDAVTEIAAWEDAEAIRRAEHSASVVVSRVDSFPRAFAELVGRLLRKFSNTAQSDRPNQGK